VKASKWTSARLAAAALCAAVGVSAWSPPAPGQPDPTILDERGWLTCRAFSGMSRGLQSAFLMGLREGWQTSAGALEANALMREDLTPEYQEPLRNGAIYLRRLIDHAGATYGDVLERTREGCRSDPGAVTWKAWIDAIARGRGPGG